MGVREIAQKIIGGTCKRLVKQTGTEFTIDGVSFGVPSFEVKIGNISTKIKELYKISQVAVALDSNQYLLCKQISQLKKDDQLRKDLLRIRIQLIMAFNNLHGILGAVNESGDEQLNKDLSDWIKYMSDLNKDCIAAIRPSGFRGAGRERLESELKQIMKFQHIDESEMNEAIKITS